ncbi:diguanylate cyclase [Vibrio ouci]|uniref:diguanylate cyclase n=1 Tax=Vibrio ouci TaxID=2499078 RepID=A0A4Y8WBS6_9VIBR|nr:diguanylate cyclase [Vibrio ouci]TFH89848.1 diguanylate cyclase [Vibrio ouci]
MSSAALQKIQALLAQMQIYYGVEGFLRLEAAIKEICLEYDFPLPLAHKHFLAGLHHDRHDQLDEAITQYNLSLSHCTMADKLLGLHVHILMGSIYADREDYHQAHQLYSYVLDNTHFLDNNYRAFAYTNISDFHLCLKQYESALKLASLGEQSARTVGNHVNQSICLLNMGYALGYLGQSTEAVKYIKQAKQIANSMNNTRVEAISNGYLAQVMSVNEGFPLQTVIEYFEQAEELYKLVIDTHNRQENLVYFAQYLEKHGLDERAEQICRELTSKIDANSSFSFFEIVYSTLIHLAVKQNLQPEVIALQGALNKATKAALARSQDKEYSAILTNVKQSAAAQERLLLEQMEEHIGLITEIGQHIATSDSIKQQLPFIFDKIGAIFPTDEFGIALYDSNSQILSYDYFYDRDGFVESTSIDCNREYSVGSYVVQTKTTVHLNHIVEESFDSMVPTEDRQKVDSIHYDRSKPVQSIILTPITLGNRVLGVLSIQHKLADQYQQYHRNLFEQLASFIAIALENHVQKQRLQQVNRQLEVLSQTDPLTGLYNRYQLDTIGPELTQHAANKQNNLAVIMIDIDYYKGFNDFYGHQMGDRALTEVAAAMKTTFSSSNDHLFRYGGDEFLILCDNQSLQEIEDKLLTLQKSIESLSLSNPRSACSQLLTLSIGAVNFMQVESKHVSFNLLCNLADKELYKAKQRGRNTFQMVSRTLQNDQI